MKIVKIDVNKYQWQFFPKSKHAGEYTIEIVLTDDHKFY